MRISKQERIDLFADINKQGDRFIEIGLWIYLVAGFVLSFQYSTFFVGFTVGPICLIGYYVSKAILKESDVHRYVASAAFGIFMAQFIYQMHGMFEMHFFAFVGCAILIAYQNWRIQLPLIIVIVVHHGVFGYLQYAGVEGVYFTQLPFMDLFTFIIHSLLAAVIVGLCGFWSARNAQKTIADGVLAKLLSGQLEENIRTAKEVGLINSKNGSEEDHLTSNNVSKSLIELSSKLADKQKALEDNNRELRSLVYALSHDLKSPLHAISSVSGWLEADINENNLAEVPSHLALLKTNVKHFLDKSDRLKYFLGISTNERKYTTVDLDQVLSKTIDELKENFDFEISSGQLGQIQTIESHLKTLFYELISNSCLHSGKEKVQMGIELLEIADGQMVIKFWDNGIGLSRAEFDKVSDLFKTQNKDYDNLTSGMGLPIISKILSNLGGGLDYEESTEGLSLLLTFETNAISKEQTKEQHSFT